MLGVAANLNEALILKMRSDPISRARGRNEVPLSTAIGLMVRERLTGQAPPEAARAGVDLVRQWIEDKAGADLDSRSEEHTSELQSLMRISYDVFCLKKKNKNKKAQTKYTDIN